MDARHLAGMSPSVLARTNSLAKEFRGAAPFPHVVIDGFLTPRLCRGLVAEFPPYDSKRFSNVYGHPAKAVYEDLRTLGPSFSALEALASSQNFLDWLGQISGIKRLLYDPFCFGGGAQENRPGMHLFPHVDFNCHPFEPWHRRINMLLYLNPGWDARWGGCL